MMYLEWCGNCNSEPAQGTMFIEDPEVEGPIELKVCLKCANAIARNSNTDLSDITQDKPL